MMQVARKLLASQLGVVAVVLAIFAFGCNNTNEDIAAIEVREVPITSSRVNSPIDEKISMGAVRKENVDLSHDLVGSLDTSSLEELSNVYGDGNQVLSSYSSSGIHSPNLWDNITCAYQEDLLKNPTEYIVPEYHHGIREVLYISGEIQVKEDSQPGNYTQAVSVDFNPVFVARKVRPRDMREHSRMYLVFRNIDGDFIERAEVEAIPPINLALGPSGDYSNYSPFYFRSEFVIEPWMTHIFNYHTIELIDGSQVDDSGNHRVIDSISRSNNLPNAEIRQPVLGENMPDESLLLSWNAVDLDGDKLRYRIWYSTNNGYSYDLFVPDLDSTSLEFSRLDDFFERFESPMARFAVSVSDGAQSIFIESATFCVPQINPRFHEINVDATGQQSLGSINYNQNIILGVTGDSEEADMYRSTLFDWHSDLVGFLGKGASILLSPSVLGFGAHTISATGKMANKIIIASATITIRNRTNEQNDDSNVDIGSFDLWNNLICAYTDDFNRSLRMPSYTYTQIYYISGTINLSEGGKWGEWDKAISVDFDPVFSIIAGSMKPRNLFEDKNLFLEFRDINGTALRTVAVETVRPLRTEYSRLKSEYFGPFTFRSEFLNDPLVNDISQKYHTISLVDHSQPVAPRVIDSINRSTNLPTATITQPVFAQSFTSNALLLAWNASDIDGDELVYRTWYSTNNGTTYEVLDYNLDSSSRELYRSDGFFEKFESNMAKFGLSVSDGAQSIFIESDTFCVPRIIPQFHELNADTTEIQLSRVINNNQTVVLSVTGNTEEAKKYNSILFDWHSNIDGYLGTNSLLLLSPVTLRSGIHTITATGKTSAGDEITVSATINVYKN